MKFAVKVALTICIAASGAQAQESGAPRVIRPVISGAAAQYRASLSTEMPGLRGYRAPMLDNAEQTWPTTFAAGQDREAAICADIVGRRLARDGLLSTLAQCIETLGARRIVEEREGIVALMRSVGFPVDLLQHIAPYDVEFGEPYSIIVDATRMFTEEATAATVFEEIRRWPFRWHKSHANFEAAADGGEFEIGTVRLQLASGRYFQGQGDGGSLDITRQLIEALPDVQFWVNAEEQHVDAFLENMRGWKRGRSERINVVVGPLALAQWAQDNAKVGFVGQDGERRPALIVPRYASRREELSVLVPGDTFAADALASQGWNIVQSSLLFQGGNIIIVRDPKARQRVMLLGEAEVHRNRALGLSESEVLEGFRTEFGVDRVVVLPALSYHIDYEVTVRTTADGVQAYVNDSLWATREILSAGLSVLAAQQVFDARVYEFCRTELAAGRFEKVLDVCETALIGKSVGYGQFPLSFAKQFSTGPVDSGVGNLQRFLLGVDTAAFAPANSQWSPPDPHGEAYARSLRLREADREKMRLILSELGWRVIPIPSTSDGDRSLNYLNGIHTPTTYWMPAYGGLYSSLDQAAIDAFRRELPTGVKIQTILTGESQRRHGGLRCSVNVCPGTAGSVGP